MSIKISDYSRDDLKAALTGDHAVFEKNFRIPAWESLRTRNRGRVYVSGLLALSNVCANNCHYCGLRRSRKIPRFILEEDLVRQITLKMKAQGIRRIFYISGEMIPRGSERLIRLVEYAKSLDLEVNLAAGVLPKEDLRRLQEAGLDFYTLKFETANPAVFAACKPDISFEERMEAVRAVKDQGIKLGSGNIVGLKGQSLDDIVDDLLLMIELDIDWAPVVPYMPAPDTPMALDTPMGDVDVTLRLLSLLRCFLPPLRITAGQPRVGSTLGFADPEGTRRGLRHGADALFVELTPLAKAENFEITASRKLPRLEALEEISEELELSLV